MNDLFGFDEEDVNAEENNDDDLFGEPESPKKSVQEN